MKRRLICALAAALIFAAALTYHTLILRELPESRVEVLALDFPAVEQALAPAAAEWGWEPVQEGERLVIRSQSPFAAPAMRAALSGASVDSQVIDYAWVADVAAQSGRLWRVWGVVWGIWLLWGLLRALVRTEWGRFQSAAESGARALQGGPLTEFEKLCDDVVGDYLAGALFVPFGEAPLVGYLAARETEYTNLRILLMGRGAGIAPDVIRSRLRASYV